MNLLARIEQHVLRLEVAVHHVEGVQVAQSNGQLPDELLALLEWGLRELGGWR